MRNKTIAAGAALCALMGGIPQLSRAQDAPAVPSPVPETATDPGAAGLEYDTSYVPFMTKVWSRVRYPNVLEKPNPLFQRYDTAAGLEKQAQTSRVALTGFRTEVFAPVKEARVGDIVEVPITIRGGVPLTAFRVYLEYEPEILEPLGAVGSGIPNEDVGFNADPDPDELKEAADRTVVAINVPGIPWKAEGPVLKFRFRALKPGESPLRASLAEIANDKFELVPLVFRSGLVKVKPGR